MSVRARGVAVLLGAAVALAAAAPSPAFDQQQSALLAVASSYLGLSKTQLVVKLRRGLTLARIANATPGKSAAGLVDRLVAPVKATLAVKVAKGELTRSQGQTLLAKVREWTMHFVRTWTLAGTRRR